MHDQAINDYLQQQVDAGLIAGAVVGVCDSNGPISITTTGYADLDSGRAMTEDTLFWIASGSKPITACAIMTLVEAGHINLDDPVEKYLPFFKDMMRISEQTDERTVLVPNETPITIRQCLSHTSGLPFLSRAEDMRIDYLSLREAVIAYAMSALLFKPGTTYSYGNAGINSVARILEIITGSDFDSYLNEHFLIPLGMRQTAIWPDTEDLKRMATCYGANDDATALKAKDLDFLTTPYHDRQRGQHPGGCYFSDVNDVMRFCRMILNKGELDGHRYISAESIAEMTRSQTGLADHHYGLGWGIDERGFGHGGAAGTHFHISPQTDRACVYLIQQQGMVLDGHQHILPWLHQHVFDGVQIGINTDGLIGN